MNLLSYVADRVFGRPLLITSDKAETILGVLGSRIGIELADAEAEAALAPALSRFEGRQSERGPYRITKEGIAVIPIIGTLVNRGAWIGASSGLVSYEGIVKQLKDARKDTEVRGILLDMDTPGGEAAGAFEVPELIRDIRKTKPVVAAVNDMAASAGYAIASAANQIYVTRTGIVGSIGVILIHYDRSKQLDENGIKPTIIHAGARKADGNPFGPLPKAVRERFQAEAENLREVFIETVIAGRPKLKKEDIRATEAGVFMGEAAVEIGLADGIATFDRVLEVMSKQLSNSIPAPAGYSKEKSMEDDKPAPDARAAEAEKKAAVDAAAAKAHADGVSEGRKAERTRLAGILALDEAKGRAGLAHKIATETDLSVEQAKAMLAAAHVEAPAAAASPTTKLYDAIAASGANPKVTHVGESGGPKGPTLADGMNKRFAKGA